MEDVPLLVITQATPALLCFRSILHRILSIVWEVVVG